MKTIALASEVKQGQSNARPEVMARFAVATRPALCPVALRNFLRASETYLLARAPGD
jgi:hypothetical protein